MYIVNNIRPSDYHGLCKANLDNEITSANDMLSFSAEVNHGVFKALAETLGTNLVLNKRFTLEDFFNNATELTDDFCNYFAKKRKLVPATVDLNYNGEINIIFRNCPPDQDETQLIISLFDGFTAEHKETNLILTNKIEFNKSVANDYFNKATILLKNYFSFSVFSDDLYYLNINDKDQRIPNAVAYFGIMYILSSIVRYKPEKIYKLINDKDTSVQWLLNKVCSIVERVYPNLMLNLLHGQNIKFSSIFL